MKSSPTMRRCPDVDALAKVIQQDDRPIDPAMEGHLASCADCQSRLDSLAGDAGIWSSVVQTLRSDSEELRLQGDSGDLPPTGEHPPSQRRGEPNRGRRRDPAPEPGRLPRPIDPPVHPEMLGRLGRFDIESMIGRGGFGSVWKAWDTELNRPVAIKLLAEHLAENATARRRFVREAQSAAAVNHANVVPIHAVHSEADVPWLVMSLVPGMSLEQKVRAVGPLPTLQVVQIALQVAAGLAAAHRQGLVHRDIKPANILLEDGSTRALITDFGLARAADDASVTQTGWLAGTPHYMSPEQAGGRDIDARSDLFSLGSVLYFLSTGRQAFRAEQTLVVLQQIAKSSPLPPRNINPEVPATLSAIIMRLLERNPRDRFQSADQLHEVLEQYLAHLQHPQSRGKPRLAISRRTRQRIAVAILAGGMALGAGGWLASRFNQPGAPSASTARDPGQAAKIEIIELSRTWGQFENEIRELGRVLEGSASQAGASSPTPWLGSFDPAVRELNALEFEIDRLESGPFLADPRSTVPFRPEIDRAVPSPEQPSIPKEN